MPIYIGLAVLIANILIVLKNVKLGVQISLVLAIVCPVSMLGSTAVKYDYFALFPLALAYLKTPDKRWNNLYYYPLLIWLISCLSSLAQPQARFGEYGISIIGAFKYALIFIFLVESRLTDVEFDKAITFAVAANALVAVFQIVDSNAIYWTAQLYAPQSLRGLRNSDSLERLVGAMGNVAPFALFMCFGLIFLTKRYRATLKPIYQVLVFVVFVVGMASASKLFIALGPCVLIALLAIRRKKDKEKRARKNWLLMACVLIGGAAGAFFMFERILENEQIAGQWNYYSSLIWRSGMRGALDSRYGSSGITNTAMDVFWQHPLIGVGYATVQNEFIGDSTYVTALHNSGIVGFLLTAAFFIRLMTNALNAGKLYAFLIVGVLVVGGFAASVQGQGFCWICLAYAALDAPVRGRDSDAAFERFG